MIYKDYYKDLGIGKTATPAEIKKAYRSLAKKYHPDKTKGNDTAEEKFKTINEANEVLSDPAKRSKYDQFGDDWKHYENAGAQPGGFDWSKYAAGRSGGSNRPASDNDDTMFDDTGVNDLFEMLFGRRSGGGGRHSRVAVKGKNLETETTISLDDAYHGTTRLIRLKEQTIKVTIKSGVVDRQMLRIEGKGGIGTNGGRNGDLFLTVKIAPHAEFQRSGNDLYCDLPVELYTALLGGKTKIKTLKGAVTVTVPKGTTNGKELSLRGLGMPLYGSKNEFGNLFVTVNIRLPEQLTDKEMELFTMLSALRH